VTAAGGWQEVGDRVFRRRYRELDLNVGAVLGDDQVLLVDTRGSRAQAAELRRDLRALTPLPCRQAVNTHFHFDHCFGNAFLGGVAVWGHRRCAAALRDRGEEQRAELRRHLPGVPADPAALPIVPPGRLVGDAGATLDVGGRPVGLRFCGRGHTDHDLVVVVGDAGVAFAGDLVEQGAPPGFDDAVPAAWPATLGRLLALAPRTVVPGHGDLVGPGFVRRQQAELAAMAELCRLVAAGELAAELAVRRAPFPEPAARAALARASW
jgi:glyoxylase-like metal-dependent hydrolase (beta-lactamase superfamily II)